MKNIIIAHQTVIDGDAISNDIMGMYRTLEGIGYKAYIYADNYIGTIQAFQNDRFNAERLLNDAESWLIYHHSIFWEQGERLLNQFKGKIIFKYHNITPAHFYKPYAPFYCKQCDLGNKQTSRLINDFRQAYWWGDSQFNCQQLYEMGLTTKAEIVPPFNVISEWNSIEPSYDRVISLINSKKINLLFIGRVVPNKGHLHLIEIVRILKYHYELDPHLWVVGALDEQLNSYLEILNQYINNYSLVENVTFTNKVDAQSIKSYYLGCDVFLCLSEHEGYCVPAIEAQYFGLPVVSYGSSALPETLGNNQIILSELDYHFAAAAIATITNDSEVRDFCRKAGWNNVAARYLPDNIEKIFKNAFSDLHRRNQF